MEAHNSPISLQNSPLQGIAPPPILSPPCPSLWQPYWSVSPWLWPEWHSEMATTESYCLTVLEAGNPKLRCWEGWFLLGALREGSVLVSLLGLRMAIFSLRLQASSLCACLYAKCPFPSIRSPVLLDEGPPSRPPFNWTASVGHLQIRSHSEALGVRT